MARFARPARRSIVFADRLLLEVAALERDREIQGLAGVSFSGRPVRWRAAKLLEETSFASLLTYTLTHDKNTWARASSDPAYFLPSVSTHSPIQHKCLLESLFTTSTFTASLVCHPSTCHSPISVPREPLHRAAITIIMVCNHPHAHPLFAALKE